MLNKCVIVCVCVWWSLRQEVSLQVYSWTTSWVWNIFILAGIYSDTKSVHSTGEMLVRKIPINNVVRYKIITYAVVQFEKHKKKVMITNTKQEFALMRNWLGQRHTFWNHTAFYTCHQEIQSYSHSYFIILSLWPFTYALIHSYISGLKPIFIPHRFSLLSVLLTCKESYTTHSTCIHTYIYIWF